MKKNLVIILSAIMMMSVVGCGGNVDETKTTATEESVSESTTVIEDETSSMEETSTIEETTSSEETKVEEESSSVEETTTEEETTTKEKETEKKTEKQTEKQTEKKTEKPTQKPEETTTSKPVQEDAPIVKKIGKVDEAFYNKAVKAFEGPVKKLRKDGLVKKSDVCVTMEGKNIKIDINYADKDSDLTLLYNSNTKIYELVVDYDFCWISELAVKINGKDSAPYNKELLKALISMVSDEVEVVYNRIDLDCFSAMGLDNEKWVNVGDISIKGGNFVADKLFSYYITKEDVDSRDKTFTLVGKNSAGKTVECILEYDSKVVKYEPVETGAYMEGNEENNIFGYPTIKTGCNSYENYKKGLIESWKAKGDPKAFATEISSYSANGYTYYWFELFYETADAKGDPEVLYVQIGANEYLELYNFESWINLEDFVNGALFIKEVKVK